MIMKRLTIAALFACSGCSGGGAADSQEQTPVALVKLARAEAGQLANEIDLYGVAEPGAAGNLTVTAPIEAQVTRILAPAGTQVMAGQTVALLSPAPSAQVDLVKASADARAANAAYARAQRLRADGLVSNAEVDAARAAVVDANALASSLKRRTSALALRAPGPGFIESVSAKPGDMVQTGAIIATIGRNGDLRGRFGVDPSIARSLRPRMPLKVKTGSGEPGFTVPISSIAPVVDPTTRLASVFAPLPAGARIAAGEPLTGSIGVNSSGSAVTIPYLALLDEGGQPYVFVVVGTIAHRHDVTVGPVEGNRVAVSRGVNPGDLIIVEGGTAVEDGMKVRTK